MKSIGALVVLWIVGTAWGFWHYSVRYAIPVPAIEAEGAMARQLAGMALTGPGPVRVLNFWAPGCGCSRFMEPHVRELVARFPGAEWRTVVLAGDDPAEAEEAWKRTGIRMLGVVDGGETARAFGIPAAPAAVVIDREGRVVYRGSYNIARFCQDEETAYAGKAIEAALAGREPEVREIPFFGCRAASR